ncbi:YceI family protein [Sphingobacterium psychroaquaticum]|uniref:Polyisoprenoid-binding protein YceI n=1 Tax=Sphingobacterium psychroaquaticum TaxID=561061 RepID=A0A1X7I9C1_9SPHI|nr:YceI family protein [Sphingobacterium psychroaquaticum]QBQ41820.1 polyisoprenoid-binding protein [Sphingobacterium psychroaquaticum]SMG10984.1 Polyisoprenoid-binding protein YceI [Sphingobacterium psychroaquaticum]
MKNLLKLVAAVAVLLNVSFAQVKWSVDPAHTNTRFEVKHLGIALIDGQFKKLEGNVETKTGDSFDGATINFTIDVSSIDTRIEARDNHLKSDDFFNAEKFPTITLKNGILKKGKKGEYTLTGDLTIRDVTKKVVFDVVQNNGIITDPWGMTRAGFTAKTKINRLEYNVKYNDLLPTGVPAVASDVSIVVNAEIVKQK